MLFCHWFSDYPHLANPLSLAVHDRLRADLLHGKIFLANQKRLIVQSLDVQFNATRISRVPVYARARNRALKTYVPYMSLDGFT